MYHSIVKGDGIGEALRRALGNVLVPEIRELQERVLSLERRMDDRFARLETKFDFVIRYLEEDRREIPRLVARVENLEKAVEKITRAA